MEQTKQQIERFLKKIAQKFPTTEAPTNDDRHSFKSVAIQWRPYGFQR